MLTILGRWVRYDNAHKTMSPDVFYGCHDNQAPANHVILQRYSNLKKEN